MTKFKLGTSIPVVYYAKDFDSTLNSTGDVTATVIKPDNTVDAIYTLTNIGNGAYFFQFTGGVLGTWKIIADVNVVGKAGKSGTAVLVISTDEDSIYSKIVSIDSKVDAIQADVGTVKSEVQNPSYGLSQISTKVDNVLGKLTNITNNTRIKSTVPATMLVPSTPTQLYPIYLQLHDTEGNMEDPDTNTINVTAIGAITGNRNNDLRNDSDQVITTMIRDGVGDYHINFKLLSSSVQDVIAFKFSLTENTKALVDTAQTTIVKEIGAIAALEATSQSILTKANNIEVKVADIPFIRTSTDQIPQFRTDVTTEFNKVEGTGFSSTLHSLKAIADKLSRGGVIVV